VALALTRVTATCTNDVAIYAVHYHAFRHAYCPGPDSYFYSALAAHQALSTWPHHMNLTWLPGHSQLLGLRSLKKSLDYAPNALHQPFTLSVLWSVIKHTKNVDWAQATTAQPASQWLNLKVNKRRVQMKTSTSRLYIRALNNDIISLSHFTRAITGHAPIAAYRHRWHPEVSNLCPTCDVPQTRDHVLLACKRFPSFLFQHFTDVNDSFFAFLNFLKSHPTAFSFASAPYEPP
jgi:hypothetical protein